VEALRYNPGDSGFDSRWSYWKFFIEFRPHHGPEVNPASNLKEYLKYLLGVKVTGAQ